MKYRSLIVLILLNILTFGIYNIFWLIGTRREMVRLGAKIPSFAMLFSPLLFMIGLFVLQLLFGFPLDRDQPSGFEQIINTITWTVLIFSTIAAFPIILIWFYRYCQAVNFVTGNRVSLGFSFGMFCLLTFFSVGFVWSVLMQENFNRYLASPPPDPNQNDYNDHYHHGQYAAGYPQAYGQPQPAEAVNPYETYGVNPYEPYVRLEEQQQQQLQQQQPSPPHYAQPLYPQNHQYQQPEAPSDYNQPPRDQ